MMAETPDPHLRRTAPVRGFEAGFELARGLLQAGEWDKADAIAARLEQQYGARPQLRWLAARNALGRGRFERALSHIAPLLASAQLAPAQRADLLLLAGEALDHLGRTGEAFSAAVEGKRLLRRLYAERAAGREGQVEKLRRLQRWFAAADPAPWREAPPEAPGERPAAGHAFILGFPRSGTTLLEQALAGHPKVAALEEAPTLAAPYAEFLADADGLERLARIGPQEAAAWRRRYWDVVRAHGVDASGKLFVDKAPAETLSLPLIAKLFPGARVIFALRDPRDVVLSCLRNDFQMNAMTYAFTDLGETTACYEACMALAATYRAVLPTQPLVVHHERLVSDLPTQITRIADFLGLAFHPAMTDPAAVARSRTVRTPSAPQVRAGLNQGGIGRWRAYAHELAPVLPVLTPWAERFGYP